ncbi:8-oxoguanine DNA glycosylase [Paraburkholderia sp. D1E]|uniref:8-oxoguanine DNA glycosylase n=1 Tax=Paraburkholderia sp. D1E TaxID=3461398 RepID=UPI00404646CD
MAQLIYSLCTDDSAMLLPDAEEEVLPGVPWGDCAALCTPAFWRALLFQNSGTQPQCRLGHNLLEEVTACVLGGYGIPAEVGLAAFEALKEADLIRPGVSEAVFYESLSRPLTIGGREISYRFARSKSSCLAHIAATFARETPPEQPLELRHWLMGLRGVGPKTASWIVRNFADTDDVAILDVHIVRAAQFCGLFPAKISMHSQYFELERRFIEFSNALGVRASALDACIWAHMKRSGAPLVRRLNNG